MSGTSDKLIGHKSNVVQDQLKPIGVVDKHDPLYDSESEDEDCFYSVMDVVTADEFRQGLNRQASSYSTQNTSPSNKKSYEKYLENVNLLLAEYLATGSKIELCNSVGDLSPLAPQLDLFVLKTLRTALDLSEEKQNDLCSLITLLYSRKAISMQHITRALEKLVTTVSDTQLDVPNVHTRLLEIIGCFLEDKCIDAGFVDRLPEEFLQEATRDSEALQKQLAALQKFKQTVKSYAGDFFSSRDTDEAATALTEFGEPNFRHEFVRLIVIASLERTDHQRETVSSALDALYGKLLMPHDIQLGLSRVVGGVDELALDTPNIADLLAKYLARSVVDEIIPPSFLLDNYRLHIGGRTGMSIMRKTQKWFSDSKGKAKAIQFRKVWTGVDPQTRECREFKDEIKDCIVEYLDSGDTAEAVRLIQDMDLTPDQCCETVRKIIVFSMERGIKGDKCNAALTLLENLLQKGELSPKAVQRGYQQTQALIEEIKLDVPDVAEQLKSYIAEAEKRNILSVSKGDVDSDPGDALFG